MTRHDHRNGLDQVAQQMPTPEGSWQEVLELLAEHGFDGMAGAMETLFNEAMKLERAAVLEAQPYERTPRRRGYRLQDPVRDGMIEPGKPRRRSESRARSSRRDVAGANSRIIGR